MAADIRGLTGLGFGWMFWGVAPFTLVRRAIVMRGELSIRPVVQGGTITLLPGR